MYLEILWQRLMRLKMTQIGYLLLRSLINHWEEKDMKHFMVRIIFSIYGILAQRHFQFPTTQIDLFHLKKLNAKNN